MAARVEELVVRYLDRVEREGPGALEALCAEEPELADGLRRRVAALASLGLLPEVPGADAPELQRLGDFELEAALGEGGMGIVYRAHQLSLGRRVALKIVRPSELYFPGARERFQREVETVARLHHPGIVPVHAVGEENGIPWFAMELVEGATLAQLVDAIAPEGLRGRSGRDLDRAIRAVTGEPPGPPSPFFDGTWVDVVLRIVRDVAEALEHAHRRGVLHRDVKPSNVMLTSAGRVLLLDFGLARSEGSARVTRTGFPLGSVHYMPPEQLSGDAPPADARGDVYSLGVLLYELLALEPPYDGPSATAVLDQVLRARPPRLRARNPAVPRDVEVVAATAWDRDPARRYASAADFAADLENLLARRPIRARPAGAPRRLWMWARRRPAAATAAGLAALVLVGGPALVAGLERRRSAAVAEKNVELEEALARVESHFQRTFGAVQEVLRLTAARELRDVPGLQEARLHVIDRALSVARELEAERPDDVEVRRERARVERLRADVLNVMVRKDEALEAYRSHLATYAPLVAAEPDRAEFQWEHGGALHQIATIEIDALQWEAARATAERATRGLGRAHELEPQNGVYASDYAQALVTTAEVARNLGRIDEARGLLDRALALRTELHRAGATGPTADPPHVVLYDLANVHLERALLEKAAGRPADAVAPARRAVELLEEAAGLVPHDVYVASVRAVARTALGSSLHDAGRPGEAGPPLMRACDDLRDLVRRFPALVTLQENLGHALNAAAIHHWETGRPERALELVREGVDVAARARAARPEDAELATLLATVLTTSSNFMLQTGGPADAAAANCERALDLLGDLNAADPMVGVMNSAARYNLALAYCQADRLDAARGAIASFEALPAEAYGLRQQADLWNEWILALRRRGGDAGREADARARMFGALERAVDAGYADLRELRSTPALAGFRDDPDFRAVVERIERGE